MSVHRPWEAPEHLLADAGVELGVNYPLPVISIEESEHALAEAMAAIQQSLVEVNDKVSYLLPTLLIAFSSRLALPAPASPCPGCLTLFLQRALSVKPCQCQCHHKGPQAGTFLC